MTTNPLEQEAILTSTSSSAEFAATYAYPIGDKTCSTRTLKSSTSLSLVYIKGMDGVFMFGYLYLLCSLDRIASLDPSGDQAAATGERSRG